MRISDWSSDVALPISRVRAVELADATGVPCAFRALHTQAVEADNAEKLEGIVHRLLGDRRPSPNREFFYVTLDEAKAAIDAAVAGKKPPKEPLALAITLPEGWLAPITPAKRLARSRAGQLQGQIGRASVRERECTYV